MDDVRFTVEVTYKADPRENIGFVARAFADINGEQDGVTHVKVYRDGELTAEYFSEDEDGLS